LDATLLGEGDDAVWDIFEAAAVDEPLAVLVLEGEGVVYHWVGFWSVEHDEVGGDVAVATGCGRLVADDVAEDAVGAG
jgi:hypothetical protein